MFISLFSLLGDHLRTRSDSLYLCVTGHSVIIS